MKKLFIISLLSLQLFACKTLEEVVSPTSTINVPELGEYLSFDANIAPDNFKYDIKTNQWEWKWGIKLELTPSPFGRLRFNKDGTYEFIDIFKSGTFKQDKNSKKILFTGYMAGAEGYFNIAKGWCKLVIQTKGNDGNILSIVYEKKSDFPQPDVKDPNGSFGGTILNMLTKTSADFIDITTGKTLKSFNSNSFPITGYSKYSISIYKKNFLDTEEIYPVIEIKDEQGNLVKKFEKTWRDTDRWDIGDYWYGMISPDGTKLALVGKYKRYISFLDPRSSDQYPMIGIIDLKTEREIFSYALDYNGNNWGPGWTPNSELVMPRKGGGINVLDASLKNIKTIYTKNVSEARMNQFGQVLFHEGSGVFIADVNGKYVEQVKNGNTNLSINKIFDLGWSADGKSLAFVVEEYLNTYNIILLNASGGEAIYFSDAKGDIFQFSSPFLNWK